MRAVEARRVTARAWLEARRPRVRPLGMARFPQIRHRRTAGGRPSAICPSPRRWRDFCNTGTAARRPSAIRPSPRRWRDFGKTGIDAPPRVGRRLLARHPGDGETSAKPASTRSRAQAARHHRAGGSGEIRFDTSTTPSPRRRPGSTPPLIRGQADLRRDRCRDRPGMTMNGSRAVSPVATRSTEARGPRPFLSSSRQIPPASVRPTIG